MKHILVTGGAGYIGSHVVLALMDQGEQVVVLDDLSTGYKVPEGAVLEQGSTGDAAFVSGVLKKYDIEAVMHLAAFVSVEESVKNPEKYFKNNTENARVLFEEVKKAGIPHVVFASTAAVYGNPDTAHIDEETLLAPVSPYGESKVRAEKIIKELGEGSYTSIILRFFNVAGADPSGRAGYKVTTSPTHLIRTAIQVALRNREKLFVYGTDYETVDGTCVRDYIHVSDIAAAHVSALAHLRAGGASNIFNCGYGHGYSVKQVIDVAKKVSGNDFTVEYAPRRAGDPAALTANSDKIKTTLGWQPQFDNLETIIKTELAWVKSQQ